MANRHSHCSGCLPRLCRSKEKHCEPCTHSLKQKTARTDGQGISNVSAVGSAFDKDSLVQRIVIVGNAGSGKSTLARILGRRLGLPTTHLDALFWQAGWVKPDAEVFRARVREAVRGDAWVCEGNYDQRTFDLRLPRADLVIWMDTPRLICLARVILRNVLDRPRTDIPADCRERLDREFLTFLRYVWNFDRTYRPRIEAGRLAHGPTIPVVRLRSAREVSRFVRGLSERGSTTEATSP
jgi:adenylate kinase family enzyme